MADFNLLKALREEINGLEEVKKILLLQERRAEAKLGEAENELNAARKVRGYLDIEIDRKRAVVLQEESKQ